MADFITEERDSKYINDILEYDSLVNEYFLPILKNSKCLRS